jgi:hypothetical protein
MATYSTLPGRLNLAFRRGDNFFSSIDFSVPVTGQTLSATVRSLVSDSQVAEFAVSVTDAAAGALNISMTAAATSLLAPGSYRWVLVGTGGGATRTYLEGTVEVAR